MSGNNLPYQLRLKKNIERQIFLDLLTKIHTYKTIQSYSYISLGGPFLEDFKLIHNYFNIQDLYSIEMDQHVIERQKFNKSISCIHLLNNTTTEFIEQFPSINTEESTINFDSNVICWLDYTNMDLRSQLYDFKSLLEEVHEYSIIKITLNAHIASLKDEKTLQNIVDGDGHIIDERPIDRQTRLKVERLSLLEEELNGFFNFENINAEQMTSKEFPNVLLTILHHIAFKAFEGEKLTFIPLTSFSYADGMTMLTFTGIVLDKSKISDFFTKTELNTWEHYNNGKTTKNIDVPYMSISEKLHIDSYLPSKIDKLYDEVAFKFEDSYEKNKKILDSYLKYYRYYPSFSKVLF